MENLLKYWSDKGYHIAIFSIVNKGKIEWTAGVRLNMNERNTWLDLKDEGCSRSSFLTSTKALEEIVKFCEEHHNKNKK